MPDPQGVAVAFTGATLGTAPTWTRLDEPGTAAPWRVNEWTISRGRQSELDKTGTGQATVTLSDPTGAFDPTNATSPFTGNLDPMKQAAIRIQNPVTNEWRYLFRGFVAEWPGDLHQTTRMETVELELVDGFALLESTLMTAGTTAPPLFGTTVPGFVTGDVYFAATAGTAQVRGRINKVLDQAGWPASWRHVFSGNIDLQAAVYSRRESALTVLLDCADAEFPAVSQCLMSRRGTFVFRGRYARFDPNSYIAADDDDLRTGPAGTGGRLWAWSCGGRPECDGDATLALVSDISWRRSSADIINAALAVPQLDPGGVTDADVDALLYKDDTSIAVYGWRFGPDMENLLVEAGNTPPGRLAAAECRLYAEYYVENYKAPQTRITTLAFRGLPLADPAAEATWGLICGVELGDPIHVTTSQFDGDGGFDDDYLIEGIRYSCQPAWSEGPPDITLELDVSPQAFYAYNPWGTALPPDNSDTPWVPE